MRQLIRFLIVGLLNTLIGLLCIWGTMYFVGLNEIAANLLGYSVALLVSFSLNRAWTFADRNSVSRSLPRWLGLAAAAYLANLALVVTAHRVGSVDAYVAQPLGIAVYTTIMFLGARHLVFRQPRLTTSTPT